MIRVLVLVLAAVVLLITAQAVLRPADFGRHGQYREGSLTDIMGQEPVHVGRAVCAACHREIHEKHAKDFHFDVECEDCHGPGRVHVLHHRDRDPTVDEVTARMPKEYTREGCLFCHRLLKARPRDFPQIRLKEHYAFVGVVDADTECTQCHDPHEPIFLLTRVQDARIHPAIFECRRCHDGTPDTSHTEVASHPTIFTCGDCHAEVVKDYAGRKHAFMNCTSCHLFHREGETAGRILKNGNRRFCLLCHEKAAFRDGTKTPLIDTALHLADAAELLERPVSEVSEDPRICLRCHRPMVHSRLRMK